MKTNLVLNSILNVLKRNIIFFIFLLFVIISVVALSLIPPQLLKIIIDKHLINNNPHGLINIAIVYLIVILFVGIFDFIKEGLLVIIGQKITTEIRIEMIYKLEKINAIFFSNNESGIIVSYFTNDVNTINSLFTNGIVGMIIDCFKIIGIVISIGIFNINLGIFTVVLLPIIYITTRIFQKLMLKAQIKNRILIGKINNHISESLKNINMIKLYSKEKYMENKYKTYIEDNFKTVEKVNYFDSIYSPIIQLIRAIVISLIILLSSKQLHYIGITLGMVAASIDFISNLFFPIENLGIELQTIQSAISGIKRVNEFYDEKEDITKNSKLSAYEIIPNRNYVSIKFNDISFSYIDNVNILENVCITINSLEKVTFIGRTGVGKSTLFNLIMGLYKPCKGSITINDIDVYDISNTEKRKIFGYVNQNFSFVTGNIFEQISLHDTNITEEEVFVSMKLVGLHEYIISLKNGYKTIIDNNNLFSQGQKQLLAIARAMVTNPPILLLDEITANLDSLTEKKIISVLQKVSDSKTILSISHRLSSMTVCDKVIILEKGTIKNIGTPDELLSKDNWYKQHTKLENLTWE